MQDEPSVFHTDSETVEMTNIEKLRTFFQAYLIAPLLIIWDDRRARFGTIIVLLYTVMGIVGSMVWPTPSPMQGQILQSPLTSMDHPLGTTGAGKDLLSVIVHSTPFVLMLMAAGGMFTSVVGTVVGLVSGYTGGMTDQVLTTISDVMITLPGLPLFLVLSVFLQPTHPVVIGVVLSVNRWAGLSRQIRSQVLSINTESYLEASRVMGVSTPRILYDDILPNIMPYVLIRFVGAARGVLYSSVALYFLGILPSSSENWGVTLQKAYSTGGAMTNPNAYHWMIIPIVVIVLLSYALTLLAQSADKLFNPRIRAKHKSND